MLNLSNVFTLGLDTLCRHNCGYNAIVEALNIMPEKWPFFQHKEKDNEKIYIFP